MPVFSSKLPIWYQLAQTIRADILSGRLEPGARVSPEVQLAQMHGVSVMPVRQALRALENERLLTRQRGRGTFVCGADRLPSSSATPLATLYSTEFGRAADVLERGTTRVPERFAAHFGGVERLAFVRRIAYRDNQPWSFGTLYFPEAMAKRITTPLLRRYPLYRIMRERCGVQLVRSHFDAQALPASMEVAQSLVVDPFSPVLFLACVTYDERQAAIGAFEMTFPSAPFTFSFETPHELA